jgi:uncharacterized short protein YbdD (DUF466 family)
MRAEIAAIARTLGRAVRRVAGMPDYQAYVAHVGRCHPDRAVPTEREYYDDFVAARYGDGPSRCC